MTDWLARNAAVVAADGDEWDRLNETFKADWKAAYAAAFVDFAVSRGWTREDAASWPEHIADEAILWASEYKWDPCLMGMVDVIECEREQ